MRELIHIGYHKTASTWLQEHLWGNEAAGFKKYLAQKSIRDLIIMPNALDFDAAKVRAYYESLLGTEEDLVSVISSERLSGNPHSGGYDSKEMADRLKKLFPDGKVFVVIREQRSAVLSSYIQYLRAGGPCKIEDYLHPSSRNQQIMPLFNFEYFDYSRLLNYYFEIFGKENVLVLPFELFKENASEFCSRIASFAEVKGLEELPFREKTNKRISALSASILRYSNKLFAKTRLNPSAMDLKSFTNKKNKRNQNQDSDTQAIDENPDRNSGAYKKILAIDGLIAKPIHSFFDKKLKQVIEEELKGRYKTSNKAISAQIGIDLAAYGYEV